MKVKTIKIKASELKEDMIKQDIIESKIEGYDILEYTYQPILGAYITIELKNYDEDGEEIDNPSIDN